MFKILYKSTEAATFKYELFYPKRNHSYFIFLRTKKLLELFAKNYVSNIHVNVYEVLVSGGSLSALLF